MLDGQLKLKSLYSMVSQGTERLIASGGVPDSIAAYMEVPYQEGDFNFPIKYGYSLVAEVVEGSDKLQGKKVHLMHPHQDVCLVAEESVYVFSGSIPAQRATLASNLETAVNAVWDAGVKPDKSVLIVGFGQIGALIAGILRKTPGQQLRIFEINTQRKEKAKALGLDLMTAEESDFDIVFHCSASETGLQYSIEKAGFEGKIVELSWYGEKAVSLQLGGSFHYGRKQIISSQVSHIPAFMTDMDFKKRKDIVFELLEDDWFDLMLDSEVPFEKLPGFFDELRQGHQLGLSALVRY